MVDSIGAGWDLEAGDGSESDIEQQITWDIAHLAMAVNLQLTGVNCWIPVNSSS